MSTLLTFEYLIQLCKNKDQPQLLSSSIHSTGQKNACFSFFFYYFMRFLPNWCAFVTAGETPGAAPADSIHMVPFQFDLMKLLPRCQQIELFFYTLSKGTKLLCPSLCSLTILNITVHLPYSALQKTIGNNQSALIFTDKWVYLNELSL